MRTTARHPARITDPLIDPPTRYDTSRVSRFSWARGGSSWLACLLCAALLSSCGGFGVRPEAPEVSVVGVRPLNLSLSGQRLLFRLKVANPNPYELPLESIDFTATFAGEKIADGLSETPVTLPAGGEAIVEVEVEAGINRLLDRFRGMIESGELALDYGVVGHVKLANWPRRIPFDVDGELENPLESKP